MFLTLSAISRSRRLDQEVVAVVEVGSLIKSCSTRAITSMPRFNAISIAPYPHTSLVSTCNYTREVNE